jgi:hypothetical protein
MVFGMPDEYVDPSGNTQAFRAFAQPPEQAAEAVAPSSKLPLIIALVVAAVVVVVLVAWFALG